MALKYAAIAGDWHVAVNWTPSGVPGAGDTVYLNNKAMTATANIDLSGGADVAMGSLIVGCYYIIKTVGDQVWSLVGGSPGTVGTKFFATAVGTPGSTGVATPIGLLINNSVTSPAITRGGALSITGGPRALKFDIHYYAGTPMVYSTGDTEFTGNIIFGLFSVNGYAARFDGHTTIIGDIVGANTTYDGNGVQLSGTSKDCVITGTIRGNNYSPGYTQAVYHYNLGGNLTINGNIYGGAGGSNGYSRGVSSLSSSGVISTGTLIVNGNIAPNGGGAGVFTQLRDAVINGNLTGSGSVKQAYEIGSGAATVTITGTINGGSSGGLLASGGVGCNVTVVGDVYAGPNYGISHGCTSLTVQGNVYGSTNIGLNTAGIVVGATNAFSVRITGNCYAGTGSPAVAAASFAANAALLYFNGNEYDDAGGTCAICVVRRIMETASGSINRIALNGSTTFVTLAPSTGSVGMPLTSNVRSGISYSNGAMTGTLVVPLPGQVSYGDVYDNGSVGTALLDASSVSTAVWGAVSRTITGGTVNTLVNAPVVPTPQEIADEVRIELTEELVRIMNCATVGSTGDQIATMLSPILQ